MFVAAGLYLGQASWSLKDGTMRLTVPHTGTGPFQYAVTKDNQITDSRRVALLPFAGSVVLEIKGNK